MKKFYQAPDFEVLQLQFADVITVSEPSQEEGEMPITPFANSDKSSYTY